MGPRTIAVTLLTLVLLIPSAPNAASAIVDTTTWVTDGAVLALASDAGVVYLGGTFSAVGVESGACAVVRSDTGKPIAPFPRIYGSVRAVLPDGAGGWYIGGEFLAVGSVTRRGAVHVLANGTVGAWDPQVGSPYKVNALGRVGGAIILGGQFGSVGGVARSNLAAVDEASGALLPFAGTVNNVVYALACADSTIYAGGAFDIAGATNKRYLVAYKLDSNIPLAFAPQPSSTVRALFLNDGWLYVGGSFTAVGDSTRSHVAAVDPVSGAIGDWNPNTNGDVHAISSFGQRIVMGGDFTSVQGEPRSRIAMWDESAHALADWNPGMNGTVSSLEATATTVRVGGSFSTAGDQARSGAAEIDLATGVPTAWNPALNSAAMVVATASDRTIVGGSFTKLYFQPRAGLAAVEASTGVLTDWYPGAVRYADGSVGDVTALAARDGVVYIGGSFQRIGGVPRTHLAAADAATGVLLPTWNPQVGTSWQDRVKAIDLSGTTMFVGGTFTSVNGSIPRAHLAELRISDGLVTSWNPGLFNNSVYSLSRTGNTLYVCGAFENIGSLPRRYLAALDLASGLPTTWSPPVSGGGVGALVVSGGSIYVGGTFSAIGGQARTHFAMLDAVTGAALPGSPSASEFGQVLTFAPYLDGVVVGGAFTSVGGSPRTHAAFVHADGTVDPDWSPNPGGSASYVSAVTTTADGGVYLGGSFRFAGGREQANLAKVIATTGLVDAPRSLGEPQLVELSVGPHPVAQKARIRFTLPLTSAVTAGVFDPAGRRVASLLHRESLFAGTHTIVIDTGGFAAGCYFIRVEAGKSVGTARLVISR